MTRRLSMVALCSMLACDSGGEGPKQSPTKDKAANAGAVTKAESKAESKPDANPDPRAKDESAPKPGDDAKPLGELPKPPGTQPQEDPAKADPAEDDAAPEDPAALPAIALPPREPPEIPVTTVAATSTEAPWREVVRPSEAVAFAVLIRGVLGKSDGGYWDVADDGQLVMRPEIQAPQSDILGYWPTNAWNIETRVKVDARDRSDDGVRQVRLMRLRGNRRWVPQEYGYEQRWEDEGQTIVMGAKGGMLVEHMGSIERVAGNADDPEIGHGLGGSLVAFFETRKGRIYTVERKDDELFALRDCEDLECAETSAMKLPSGTRWGFTSPVPRQKNSVSVVGTLHDEAGDKAHLLHYETGGWKLDALPGTPRGLWPTKDGGLWVLVDDELLHRDPDAGWRSVTLPDGASSVTAAMRGDFSELWIAATVGGSTVVFATHANAQKPPPEPEPQTAAG